MLLEINGVVIDATEEHAKRLLDNGWAKKDKSDEKGASKPARKPKE